MLHYSTIDSKTLELLKELQRISFFKQMRLVGGTALALQIGHRVSIDIDLFGNLTADEYEVSERLNAFKSNNVVKKTENISINIIEGVKVDIVNYPYPWIDEPFLKDGIVMASQKDIAAMKLAAITGRGTKKDFIDVFFLMQKYSMGEMLSFYEEKYSDGNLFLVFKSILYFDDADNEQTPKMLKEVEWKKIKTSITNEVNKYFNLSS
jgi:predicted nucleotidyltransferase component of viral defense system